MLNTPLRPKRLITFLSVLFALLCLAPAAHALDNGLARTPPMGWNSWNKFACEGLNEKVVREDCGHYRRQRHERRRIPVRQS